MKTYLKRLWHAFKGQDHEMQDLLEFNRRYNLLIGEHPNFLSVRLRAERFRYLLEEATEFNDATTFEDMADALIDVVYIAKGTAVMMGLPWEALWEDVQRANMAKQPASTARSPRDVVKPEGWQAPDGWPILFDAGFMWGRSTRFTDIPAKLTREYPEQRTETQPQPDDVKGPL